MQKVRQGGGISIVLAGVLVLALLVLVGLAAPSEARRFVTGQGGPTPTTPAWAAGGRESDESRLHQTVEQWANDSTLVAEVEVETIEPSRFNTDNRAFPTESPNSSQLGLIMGAPVGLRILQEYKGVPTDVAGLVVWQPGGEYYDYEYRTYPPFIFSEDSRGVLFGKVVTPTAGTGRQLEDVLELAEALSMPGAEYKPAWINTFYEYDGSVVLSALEGTPLVDLFKPLVMPIEEFSAGLAAGLP